MRFRKVGVTAWSVALFVAGTSCNVTGLENNEEYEIELTSVDQFGSGASTTVIEATAKIESAELDDITTPLVIDEDGGLLVTNNSGFTSVTGVANGAWNQLPQPTVYTVINTNTDTQVFGVDVDGNTVIGNGDDSVLFNQSTNAIEFGSNVTIGSNVDQTINVSSSLELNDALVSLSKIVPAYKAGGFTASINITSGTVLNEQIAISGVNLSFITITSDDLTVDIDGTSFVGSGGTGLKAFIFAEKGGVTPLINTTFNYYLGTDIVGAYVLGSSSFISIEKTKGFNGFKYNAIIHDGGSIFAESSVMTNATSISLLLDQGSSALVSFSDFSGSNTGVSILAGSNINLTGATLSNTTLAITSVNSTVVANLLIANLCERIFNGSGGSVDLSNSNFDDWLDISSSFPVLSFESMQATLNEVSLEGASNTNNRISVRARYGTVLTMNDSFLKHGVSDQGRVFIAMSQAFIFNTRDYTMTIDEGAYVTATQLPNVTFPQPALTPTSDGIIFY